MITMQDYVSNLSLSNLRGVPLAVFLIIVIAIAAHFGIYALFKGSVQI